MNARDMYFSQILSSASEFFDSVAPPHVHLLLVAFTKCAFFYFFHLFFNPFSLDELVAPAVKFHLFFRNYLAEVDCSPLAIASAWIASPNIAEHQHGWLVRVRHSHC
jgi:hypothetical protein